MPRKATKSILLLMVIATACIGCVNLQHVSEFSQDSIEGIEKFETLSHSYTQNCLDDCLQRNIAQLKIHNISCDCTADQKADSITRIIYDATQDYFYALADISNNELTNYRTEGFTQALATGNYGPIQLNEADVTAYSEISSILLRAFTDGYRRNKIKKHVADADSSLQVLLKYLDLNLSGNLRGKLEVQKKSLKNHYFDLVADENLSVYERSKFAEDYFTHIAQLDAEQRELDAYSQVLKTISQGHTALNANLDKLTTDDVRALLGQYGNQLQGMITVFNKKTE